MTKTGYMVRLEPDTIEKLKTLAGNESKSIGYNVPVSEIIRTSILVRLEKSGLDFDKEKQTQILTMLKSSERILKRIRTEGGNGNGQAVSFWIGVLKKRFVETSDTNPLYPRIILNMEGWINYKKEKAGVKK